jgi:alanyl-tRNA synthetase
MEITREELIGKYLKFFISKSHQEIKNSSLVPENDPTVLFTTAGMHPLVPFLLGEKHPQGKRLVNVQRCIRTGDIEEVGNEIHHTFFEMLGNWSLGDYFKGEAIKMTFEFHTKCLGIPLGRYAVSVFGGEEGIEKDEESIKTWRDLGVSNDRIALLGKKDNFWELPSKNTPCGPCTEQFFWKENHKKAPKIFNPKDKGWVEIGNDVLMQYVKDKESNYVLAKQKNIDFGGGVERTLAVLNGFDDNYLTEVWQPIIKGIEKLSKKSYRGNEKKMRIIADHLKAAVFIISDGIVPSNSGQGYVLRRLIRRAIRHGRNLDLQNFVCNIVEPVFEIYEDYELLKKNKKKILEELEKEENKFLETLEKGMNLFAKMTKDSKKLSGKDAFLLYQSYGFPIEMTSELAQEEKIKVDLESFEGENKKHQELSRTASAGTFKSGLADDSESTTRLHTATHLLNQALRIVLKNPEIFQKGSNITPERLRFDFNLDRKMTSEEIKQVEDLVNDIIREKHNVVCEEMSVGDAKKRGAQGVFDSKYKDRVKVYSIGDFSREICAGPHVKNTSELGKFRILKEESSSAGVRRIKAVLEYS